jgi:uncharacterized pyridoxamine 5'-phosphate oxidase family protein
MKEVAQYLRDARTFYLATDDNGQPRVRPFGAVAEFEDKLYLVTNNKKDVYRQMLANPKVEISAMHDNTWIRLTAEAVHDDRREARVHMLQENPGLGNMYNPDDNLVEVLYLKNATATVYKFGGEPKVYTF